MQLRVSIILYFGIYRYHAQGAVDIYQCFAVQISDCLFEHNGPVSIARNHSYRGHSGGVSVGFNCGDNCSPPDEVGLSITNCRFQNNTSNPRKSVQNPSMQSLVAGRFPGRGGAMSITINSNFEYNLSITGCLVVGNYALTSGSGIFSFFTGYRPHHMTVRDTVISNNTGPLSGGAIAFAVERSRMGVENRLEVYNSHFTMNRAKFGGGIFIYSGGKGYEAQVIGISSIGWLCLA